MPDWVLGTDNALIEGKRRGEKYVVVTIVHRREHGPAGLFEVT